MRRHNARLWRGYEIKEMVRAVYERPAEAWSWLEGAIRRAARSRLKPFRSLAKTLRQYRAMILAAVEHGLSNSPLEALNSRLALINHRAAGFHSAAAFIALAMLFVGGFQTGPAPPVTSTNASGEPEKATSADRRERYRSIPLVLRPTHTSTPSKCPEDDSADGRGIGTSALRVVVRLVSGSIRTGGYRMKVEHPPWDEWVVRWSRASRDGRPGRTDSSHRTPGRRIPPRSRRRARQRTRPTRRSWMPSRGDAALLSPAQTGRCDVQDELPLRRKVTSCATLMARSACLDDARSLVPGYGWELSVHAGTS